ncbi:regulator of G-protein signaling [Acrasis kona]|uniref:Regulator of G-protein signaling n=1 Tax=Acrasis kona TaxID=1008807 RepID=A0AAW2YW23_9EUKA
MFSLARKPRKCTVPAPDDIKNDLKRFSTRIRRTCSESIFGTLQQVQVQIQQAQDKKTVNKTRRQTSRKSATSDSGLVLRSGDFIYSCDNISALSDLDQIMSSPTLRLRLLEFSKNESSLESILLLMELIELKSEEVAEKKRIKAMYIHDTFIKIGSPHEVNINYDMKHSLNTLIQNKEQFAKTLGNEEFKNLEREVGQDVIDVFFRYMSSLP